MTGIIINPKIDEDRLNKAIKFMIKHNKRNQIRAIVKDFRIRYERDLNGLGRLIKSESPYIKGIASTAFSEIKQDPESMFSKYAGEYGGLGANLSEEIKNLKVDKRQLWFSHLKGRALRNAKISGEALFNFVSEEDVGCKAKLTGNSVISGKLYDSSFTSAEFRGDSEGSPGRYLWAFDRSLSLTHNSQEALQGVIFEDYSLVCSTNIGNAIRYSVFKGEPRKGTKTNIKETPLFFGNTLQRCILYTNALEPAEFEGEGVLEGSRRHEDYRINKNTPSIIRGLPTISDHQLEQRIMSRIPQHNREDDQLGQSVEDALSLDLYSDLREPLNRHPSLERK